MTLRRWTTENIQSEKTLRWWVASCVKYVIEGALAAFLGLIVSSLIFALYLLDEFPLPFGVAGPLGLWMVISGLILYYFTHCKYTDLGLN